MRTHKQALLSAYIFATLQEKRASDDERKRFATNDKIDAEQRADAFLLSHVDSDEEHNVRVMFALARLTLIVASDERAHMRNLADACASLLAVCDDDETLNESVDELIECVEHDEAKTHVAHALVCVIRDSLAVWDFDVDALTAQANHEHARDEGK